MSRRGAWLLAAALMPIVVTGCDSADHVPPSLTNADAGRGRAALERYECGACHLIPGVRGAVSLVGPPLEDFGRRVRLAGRFANAPDVLVRWIRNPPALKPDTAMPAVGVSDAEARDMAAYLYGLE